MIDNELLSEKAVSKEFRLTVPWQRKKRREGDGPPFLKIGRLVRYRRQDIEAFLSSCLIDRLPDHRSQRDKKATDLQAASQMKVCDGHTA